MIYFRYHPEPGDTETRSDVFRYACYMDRKDIAEWILSTNSVDVDRVFKEMCDIVLNYRGSIISIASPMRALEWGNINPQGALCSEIFKKAKLNNRLEMVKWLSSIRSKD